MRSPAGAIFSTKRTALYCQLRHVPNLYIPSTKTKEENDLRKILLFEKEPTQLMLHILRLHHIHQINSRQTAVYQHEQFIVVITAHLTLCVKNHRGFLLLRDRRPDGQRFLAGHSGPGKVQEGAEDLCLQPLCDPGDGANLYLIRVVEKERNVRAMPGNLM